MTYSLLDIRLEMPRHPTRIWRVRTDVKRIVVHTTGSDNQDPKKTGRYHVTPSKQNHISKRGAPGLCYHDFITKCGVVYHCNNYQDIVWHTKGWNGTGVGVCLAFRGQTGEAPPLFQYIALVDHLVVLCLYLKVLPKNVKGHRESPLIYTLLPGGKRKYRKTCPGMGISLHLLRAKVTNGLQERLSSEGLYTGKIDGLFGRKSICALRAFKPCHSRIL